jgi:hypothetical protein
LDKLPTTLVVTLVVEVAEDTTTTMLEVAEAVEGVLHIGVRGLLLRLLRPASLT